MYQRGGAYKLGPFYRGVHWDKPPEFLPPDALCRGANFQVLSAGQVTKRPGCELWLSSARLGTQTPSDQPIDLLANYEADTGDQITLTSCDDVVYLADTSGGTVAWTDVTNGVTVTGGEPFEWASANGVFVACNGTDEKPITFDAGTSLCGSINTAGSDAGFDTPKHVAYWDNRLWFANVEVTGTAYVNRIYYSDPGDINTYDATAFYNIGGPINGIAALGEVLTIHTERSIWTISPTQNDQIPYELKEYHVRGSLCGRGIASLPGSRLIFPLTDGFYMWKSGEDDITKVSFQLDRGYWPYLNQAQLALIWCLVYPGKDQVWFFVPYGGSQSTTNNILVYEDYQHPEDGESYRWVGPWKSSTVDFDRNCGTIINNEPVLGSYDGYVFDHYDADNDYDPGTDSEKGIATTVETAASPPVEQSEEIVYRWMFARHRFKGIGSGYEITCNQIGEGLPGKNTTVDMTSPEFILDISQLDIDAFGSSRVLYVDSELLGYGSNTRLQYVNAVKDQNFEVHEAMIHYRSVGRKRRRKART